MTVEVNESKLDKSGFKRWLRSKWNKIPQFELVIGDEVITKLGENGVYNEMSETDDHLNDICVVNEPKIGYYLHELRKQEIVEQERYFALLKVEQKRNPTKKRTIDDYNRIKMQVMWEVGNEKEYLLLKSTLERDS